MSNNNVQQLLADSKLAFINQQNEVALSLANEAKKIEPNNPEAHKCAGNAYMSMERYEEAIKSYSIAAKYEPNNGNRYYDLGFAYATADKLAYAMKNFAKAEELGCSPENLVQLYNILGIICFDIGRYDDALINLKKAEQLIGIDMDILQRKAVIYGIKEDIRSGLLTANQIKMVAPSEYRGYQIAFKLLIQAKRFEVAKKELEKAEKYVKPCMDLYFDNMTFELEKYHKDKDRIHLNSALDVIEKALQTVKPTVTEVMESYINAAEIYLQLEEPEETIQCLNAAQNPANAYNNGFKIVAPKFEMVELTEYDVEDMIETDRAKIAEEYGDYGLEEFVESYEPDAEGNRDFFTEIEDEMTDDEAVYKLDESEKMEYTSDNVDQINRLYVGAYTLKQDFDKVIEYAKKMQASENVHNTYIGKYAEVNAMKKLETPDVDRRYEEVIRFFRNAMIKDPTDIMAVTMRIQCYIDIGNYEEAEKACSVLTKEVRENLLEKINEAKAGGVR